MTTDTGAAIVYRLNPGCTTADISEGERFHATVNGVVAYGVFVDISESISGLVHESELDREYDVGDELVVELDEMLENGDLSFRPADIEEFETVERRHSYDRTAAADLGGAIGEDVHLEGEVVQAKQTGGPTVFQVRDETGVVPCAAFESAGVRAYPEVGLDDIVHLEGQVEAREESVQVEVDTLEILDGERRETATERLAAALDERAEPPTVEPLVEWPALAKLFPDLEAVARQLRRTVLEGRPIRIRHHADGDGMCASLPLQRALENFIAETHADPDATRHLLRRSPSKAPFYEMEDATRDLNFALSDNARHGQKLPLLLMVDNGSTAEDVPGYKTLRHYDVPVLVVDHHHPDPDAVEGLLDAHVNPYLHGEDYRITTGMLCTELARMIDPSLTSDLRHVPAVAGLADRSKADAMDAYLELAQDAGYEEPFLRDVSEALDYAAFHLRYDPGTDLVADLLDVGGNEERHRTLVPFLADCSREAAAEQVETALPHVEERAVANGARLQLVDVENHARRFTYPAPGKTTGEIHDRTVEETGDPVITVGYGPDFAVLRSDGVRLDIPEMVAELNEEIDGGGVSGGGHLVVGSIKFVSGMREAVLDALIEKMGEAEIDESLQVGAPRS